MAVADARPVRLERPAGCYFDEGRANRAVRFFREHLKHTKGSRFAGKPFGLRDWQEVDIREIFGRVNADGQRTIRQVYAEIPKKNGKALAVDTPIPVPSGWKAIGDLVPGDEVFDEHGHPCEVLAVSPVMVNRPCYRLRFADDEEIIADAEHEWFTSTRKPEARSGIYTTREIAGSLRIDSPGSQGCNHSILVSGPIQCPKVELPISPYVLGAWIGDGNSRNAGLTVSPEDRQILEEITACGVSWHLVKNGKGKSVWTAWLDIHKALRESGMLRNKHIPAGYLRASGAQRTELLCGLMDTDGYVSKAGQCEFTTTKRAILDGALELLWSLGFKPTLKTCRSMLYGKDCGPNYRVQFWAFDDRPVFKLARKLSRQKRCPGRRARSTTRQILSVDPVDSVPVRCIQVASKTSLYLAGRSMVPTHNSEIAAGIALKLLYADDEPGAEIYGAAADKDQASIVFDVAASMVRRNPLLYQRSKVIDGTKRIVVPTEESFYRAITSEVAGKHGYNIHGCIFDEIHAQRDRRLWDVLTFGAGDARTQPLIYAITTAGIKGESPVAEELHDYADQILRGVLPQDPTFYPVMYAAPEDADWRDEDVWHACNPALGDFLRIDAVRAAAERAKRLPSEQNSFRRLRLNQWVNQETRFIDMADWDRCSGPVDLGAIKNLPCYAGLDLSTKLDVTALVLAFLDGNGVFHLLPHFWLPSDNMQDRPNMESSKYRQWAQKGLLNLTQGNVIDYSSIRRRLNELRDQAGLKIREVAFDPWNAAQFAQGLQEDGFLPVEVRQGYRTLSEPTKELQSALVDGKVRHGGHPVLRWMADCMTVRSDDNGNVRPVKPDRLKSSKRIDGIVAAIMAMSRALANASQVNHYESRRDGFLVM